jgi:membrane peptidoglycan carboxypeptidase
MLRLARPARHEGGVVHQIAVIAGISALSGVLMAGLALPWLALAKQGAEQSAQAVKDFPLKLTFKPLNERTKVLDSRGHRIATFYDENRKYVPLDKISLDMQKAIVAIEDSRFYEHGALDIKGTLRALVVNSTNNGVVQGGSSITQQLVKMTRVENASTAAAKKAASDDTFARKFQELRYAVWVEDHLTKDQILEHYLNAAYFGDGAYGIEAAAHHYFSTSAAKLNLAQAALLAGIVRNPSGYNPTIYPGAAQNRRDTVIDRMLATHVITTNQARAVKKIKVNDKFLKVQTLPNGCVESSAPWFCSYLLEYLKADPDLGATLDERVHQIYGGGLTIKTTLDMRFQRAADTAVKHHVYPTDNAIGGLALVSPGTGYVRALAQSRPMGTNKKKGETFINYAVPKKYGDSNGFQPGSTFKAFVLSAALQMQVPLNTVINSPQTMNIPENSYKTCGGHYYPSSQLWHVSSSTTSGAKDLYTGTRESVNTFYAQLEQITGLCKPWKLAKEMGVELEDPGRFRVPSFTLGVTDVSPLEMAEAYATFANRGVHCSSTPVLEIRDRSGKVMPTTPPTCKRVLKAAQADAVNDVLRGVIEGGFASAEYLGASHQAAGKTGTVTDQKAVWFVGYTPTLVTASMVAGANRAGHPITLQGQTVHDNYIAEACGSCTAAPMWGEAMKEIVNNGWLPSASFHSPNPQVVEGQSIDIPSVYGMSASEASSILTRLGFKVLIASTTVSSTAPANTVAYTSPEGSGVSGQLVYIYLSNGVPPAPPAPTGGGGGGNGGGHGGGGGGGGHGGGNGPPGPGGNPGHGHGHGH